MPIPRILYPSPRVSQLDADILDDELFSLLKQQLSDAFLLVSSKTWAYNLHPELWTLILKLAVFKLTTLNTGSSYGYKLQNLKLSDKSSGQLVGRRTRYFLLGAIIGEYLLQKAQSYLISAEIPEMHPRNMYERVKHYILRHKTKIIQFSSDTVQILETLNFLAFLVFGRYPNLVYRALGVSVTPIVADLLKFNGTKVNFEFQNRQLVWNIMTEFLVFILPLLQLRKLRRILRTLLPKGNDELQGTSKKPLVTKFSSLPISQCAMCIETNEARGIKAVSNQVTNPFVTNCTHTFCYVCLATRFNAIENGNEQAEGCPRCRVKLTSFRQYGVLLEDVDECAIMVDYVEVPSDEEEEGENEEKNEKNESDESDDSLDYLDAELGEELEKGHVAMKSPIKSSHLFRAEYSEHEDLEEEGEFSDDFENGNDYDDDEEDDDDDDDDDDDGGDDEFGDETLL